jgi:hypothetical protein
VLRAQVLKGKLSLTSLQSLSSERPLFLELTESVPAEVYGSLIADRWFHRVLTDGVTSSDAREAAQSHLSALRSAERTLLRGADNVDLARRLSRLQFFHALASAAVGDLPSARENLESGLRRAPADAHLLRLRSALPAQGKLGPEAVLDGSP